MALMGRLLQATLNLHLVAFFMGVTMGIACGQTPLPGNLPQNVLPGTADSPLQRSIEGTPTPSDKKGPTEVDIKPPDVLQEEVKLPSFRLSEIQLRNVNLLSREELAPIIQPLIDTDVTETELMAATRQITQLYHDKGYRTSRAFLPSQTVSDGIVVILAQESRFGNLYIEGNKRVTEEWVKKHLSLKADDFFNVDQLERDLKQLKKSPKIFHIRANIKPSEKTGYNDTVLEITETRPAQMVTSWDNTGRQTIGLIRFNTILIHNNLWGAGHQGILGYTGATGLHALIGQYAVPLNEWGWNLGVRGSAGFISIGDEFKPLDITGRSSSFGVFTSAPLYQGEQTTLIGEVGFNSKRANTYAAGERISVLEQDIRTVSGGLTLTSFDNWGRWLLAPRIELGVGDEARFTKFQGSILRTIRLPANMVLVLKGDGQYAAENMPGMEQMQIGGFSTVRGYDEGMLIADKGYVLGSELHMPMWGFPDIIRHNMEWLVFAEGGRVSISQKDNPLSKGQPGSLFSLGIGVRGKISRYLSGRLDVGFAQHNNLDQPTGRVHFGISGMPF